MLEIIFYSRKQFKGQIAKFKVYTHNNQLGSIFHWFSVKWSMIECYWLLQFALHAMFLVLFPAQAQKGTPDPLICFLSLKYKY